MRKAMLVLTIAILAFGYTVCYSEERMEPEKQ